MHMEQAVRRILLFSLVLMACTACRKGVRLTAAQQAANQLIETDIPVQTLDSANVTNAVNGFYVCLPAHYKETTKSYPLLVSLHGGGQTGSADSDLRLLLNDGIAQTIQTKKFLPSFTVNGQNFSFIVLCPQFNGFPSSQQVEDFILFARRRYRVDASRVYLTGLSMGGIVCSKMGGDFTAGLAAIVPMSGTVSDSAVCQHVARGKLPVWVFHNKADKVVDVGFPIGYVSLINRFNPTYHPRLTLFNSDAHDAWTLPLDPGYREEGKNIYEWMLQYAR